MQVDADELRSQASPLSRPATMPACEGPNVLHPSTFSPKLISGEEPYAASSLIGFGFGVWGLGFRVITLSKSEFLNIRVSYNKDYPHFGPFWAEPRFWGKHCS